MYDILQDYKFTIAKYVVEFIMYNISDDNGNYNINEFNETLTIVRNDLRLDESYDTCFQYALRDNMPMIDLTIAIVTYAYEITTFLNPINTFPRLWAIVSHFINYFKIEFSFEDYLSMIDFAEDLSGDIEEGASWHRKTIAKIIVEDAIQKFNTKEDVKRYAYQQAYKIHGFENDIVIEIKRLIDEEFNYHNNYAEAISRLAFEYLFTYKKIDYNAFFQWIDSKIVIADLLGISGTDGFTDNIVKTNSMDLFLNYLKLHLIQDEVIKEGFVSTYGNLIEPGVEINSSMVLNALIQTAHSELIEEHGTSLSYHEIIKLRNDRVYQMLEKMGLNNDEFNILFEEYLRNEREEFESLTLQDIVNMSPFKF